MTLSIKHKFVSAKTDGTDATLIRPSNWNDAHDISLSTNSLIGRATAGAGPAEEITCTALARAILASADAGAVLVALGLGAFSTGDVKLTLKTSADPGWIMMNDQTIGSVSSAAAFASADAQALYELIWTNVSDTYAPVTGGRGGTASGDFGAGKPMRLTKVLGRALAAAGSGSGLSSRMLGATVGEEANVLTIANLIEHDHTVFLKDPGHTHSYEAGFVTVNDGGGYNPAFQNQYRTTGSIQTRITIWSDGAGTGTQNKVGKTGSANPTPMNNMQPTAFLNVMIKL